jgi:hypothetical protein
MAIESTQYPHVPAYTSPKGAVIFDHPYNAESERMASSTSIHRPREVTALLVPTGNRIVDFGHVTKPDSRMLKARAHFGRVAF